jgi:hypothetical protein
MKHLQGDNEGFMGTYALYFRQPYPPEIRSLHAYVG